ncbi:uncharacterized protein LOC100903585 [Galendromus occidentalis]|uniref:Uncharacterized protein LOC100903585 n=1 Tax=Galendromus occidentalis TaxID=34638 RepID=A0AAJ7SIT1_9ACAR|nr:uncharacterized protein LOC100903585 [Galendromus occidentalis]
MNLGFIHRRGKHAYGILLSLLHILIVVHAVKDTQWDNALTNIVQPEARLQDVQVACGKRHMRVHLDFGPQAFQGLVFSKGYHGHPDCVYIKSGSSIIGGVDFDVFYDKCGTKPDHAGSFYENTIVIQYGQDVIEAWDEAKRLRCEWHDAYEKSALKSPSIQLADLEVQELNFQGDNIGCWMEIQEGKGPWARQVSSIVPLGSPLTMVVAIADDNNEFDMRVKSCWAHDGVRPPLHLTDEDGCVLRPKMLTPFLKVKDTQGGRASIVSYSHFYAFKFPDTIEVQMQCVVEICRNGCPKDCHSQDSHPPHVSVVDHQAVSSNNIIDKKPLPLPKSVTRVSITSTQRPNFVPISLPPRSVHHPFFIPPPPSQRPGTMQAKHRESPLTVKHSASKKDPLSQSSNNDPAPVYIPTEGVNASDEDDPASLESTENSYERSEGSHDQSMKETTKRFSAVRHQPQGGNAEPGNYWKLPLGTRNSRIRRDIDDFGVRGSFRVVAVQDLAFKPNISADEAMIVYDARQHIDIVYGTVCFPAVSVTACLGLLALFSVCSSCIAAYLFWVLRTYSALKRNKCIH